MDPLIVILAAGYGERLYLSSEAVTLGDEQFPKGMLEIEGKRVIEYKLEALPPKIR